MALTTNLVCYLKLDDAANGTRVDSSGNGNDFADNSGNVGQGTGIISNAATFGSLANQNLKLASGLLPSGAFSVSAWVNVNSLAAANPIWGQTQTGTLKQSFGVLVTTGLVRLVLNNPTVSLNSATALSAGGWHHVVATYDGTNANIYIDGVYDATGVKAYSGTPNGEVIGAFTLTGTSMNGSIDELGMWTRQLTDGGVTVGNTAGGEIAQLYNGGAGFTYPFVAGAPRQAMHSFRLRRV